MLIEYLNESSLKILFSKIKTSSEAEDIKTLIASIQNKIVKKRLLEFINEFEEPSHDEIKTPALSQIHIGPIATPDIIQFAPALPKTRSGKIMRRILRKIAANEYNQLGDTTTLADPSVVESLIENRQNK